jgi:hypothetical protein
LTIVKKIEAKRERSERKYKLRENGIKLCVAMVDSQERKMDHACIETKSI